MIIRYFYAYFFLKPQFLALGKSTNINFFQCFGFFLKNSFKYYFIIKKHLILKFKNFFLKKKSPSKLVSSILGMLPWKSKEFNFFFVFFSRRDQKGILTSQKFKLMFTRSEVGAEDIKFNFANQKYNKKIQNMS